MGSEKCIEGFLPALRLNSCKSTFLKSRQVTCSGEAPACLAVHLHYFLWKNWQNWRWIIPLSLFPLQGSIGGPSSGSWPSWKPGGWLRLRRWGRGGRQPSAPRAQCSLPGGHLLTRHCWNDRRWGGESFRSVERNCRKGNRPKISSHYCQKAFYFKFQALISLTQLIKKRWSCDMLTAFKI